MVSLIIVLYSVVLFSLIASLTIIGTLFFTWWIIHATEKRRDHKKKQYLKSEEVVNNESK